MICDACATLVAFMRNVYIIILLASSFCLHAQPPGIEAKLTRLNDSASIVNRSSEIRPIAKTMLELAHSHNLEYWHGMALHHMAVAAETDGKWEESLRIRREAISIFKAINRQDKISRQYLNYGITLGDMGQYDSALYLFTQGLELAKKVDDTLAITGSYLNISSIYHELGQREKELEFLLKALNNSLLNQDSNQIASIKYNLSIFHYKSGDLPKCIEILGELKPYYQSANHLHGLAQIHNLRAQIYFDMQQFDSALIMLDSALQMYEQLGDVNMVAFITMNQGSALGKAEKLEESIEKIKLALSLFEKIGERKYVALCLHELSATEEIKYDLHRAAETLRKAISISEEIGTLEYTATWYKELANLLFLLNQSDTAYKALLKHTQLSDSLASKNKQETIQEMEAKYQNEKKQLEIQNLRQEKELQQAALDNERSKRLMMLSGLIVTLLVMGLILLVLLQKQRANKIIRKQKIEVENQRDKIQHQKLIVEEKNREITESIQYAKRIQTAILPPDSLVAKLLPESFVLYKPKDVVAGDFYWLQEIENVVYFAAADCTGHGVPGAMVSVVCHNALNRSVREFGLRKPGEILDKTRDLVIQEFEKSEEEVKDGMDISLCALSLTSRTLHWAGANNPLWIVKMGTSQIDELKGDKQPIGKFANPEPFTTHMVHLQKGDTIYIFSDGFADQFGGKKGKKLKSSGLKDLLLNHADKPLNEQYQTLAQFFESWRGELEQLDDVCILAVRV